MALYAMADLHLAMGVNKPMDIFGLEWIGYMDRIRENWERLVTPGDTVLIPGDFCWATYLPEAVPDFAWLHTLPGEKVLSKGNHDYWWTTRAKIDKFLEEHGFSSVRVLHNDAMRVGSWAIAAARGWTSPGDAEFSADDRKIWLREQDRLKLSLEAAAKLGAERLLVMLHYPPFNAKREPGAFVDILKAYGCDTCVYGHLHGRGRYAAIQGVQDDIRYKLVAADSLQFAPWRVDDGEPGPGDVVQSQTELN